MLLAFPSQKWKSARCRFLALSNFSFLQRHLNLRESAYSEYLLPGRSTLFPSFCESTCLFPFCTACTWRGPPMDDDAKQKKSKLLQCQLKPRIVSSDFNALLRNYFQKSHLYVSVRGFNFVKKMNLHSFIILARTPPPPPNIVLNCV